MKKKTKIIASAVAVSALCASVIAGSTFALFTSESQVNIAVTSATVDVTATIGTISATGLNGVAMVEAGVEGNSVVLNNIAPGDKVNFDITVENKSSIQVQYRTKIECCEGEALMSELVFTVGESDYSGLISYVSAWDTWSEAGSYTIPVAIELPEEAEDCQGITCKISYVVEAVQGNATTDDESGLIKNTGYYVSNANEFKAATRNVADNGVINLTDDFTLTSGVSIISKNVTLNGNGHTITLDMGPNDQGIVLGAGGTYSAGNVTVKDLTVEGTAYSGLWVSHYATDKAGVDSVFENVTVTGQYYYAAVLFTNNTGATLTNCHIENNLPDSKAPFYEDIGTIGVFSSNYLAGPMTLNNTTVDTWFINGASLNGAKVYLENQSAIDYILVEKADPDNKTYTVDETSSVGCYLLCKGKIPQVQSGEYAGAYAIYSADYLAAFAADVNGGNSYQGKTVILADDIDLAGIDWTPIGTDKDHPFLGTFDGLAHTVSNLNVTGNQFVGLFGYIDKPAVVKNLTVENANVEGYMCVGVVVGDNYIGTIDNVTVLNSTIKSNRQTGGITGYSYGTVKNCLVDGLTIVTEPNMTDNGWDNGDKVGGIIGYGPGTYVLNNTAKNVSITAWRDFGGVAGYLSGDGGNKFDGNHAENITLRYIEWYNEDGSRVLTVGDKVNQTMGAIAGYRSTSDGENTYENVDMAVVKTVLSEDTFIQSVTSLQAGETLVLGSDVVVSSPINNLKDVTIDANGHEIVINGINDVKGDNVTILNAVFSSENSKAWGICMDSVTFRNCTFDGVSPYLDGSKPIVIDNCIIKNTYLQLGERSCFDNVTITNNTFILNNTDSESHAIVLGGSTKEFWENGAVGLVLEGNTFNPVNEADSYIAYYIYAAGDAQLASVPVFENNTYNGDAYYSMNGTSEGCQIKL